MKTIKECMDSAALLGSIQLDNYNFFDFIDRLLEMYKTEIDKIKDLKNWSEDEADLVKGFSYLSTVKMMADYEHITPSEAAELSARHKSIVDPPYEFNHTSNRSATVRLWCGDQHKEKYEVRDVIK